MSEAPYDAAIVGGGPAGSAPPSAWQHAARAWWCSKPAPTRTTSCAASSSRRSAFRCSSRWASCPRCAAWAGRHRNDRDHRARRRGLAVGPARSGLGPYPPGARPRPGLPGAGGRRRIAVWRGRNRHHRQPGRWLQPTNQRLQPANGGQPAGDGAPGDCRARQARGARPGAGPALPAPPAALPGAQGALLRPAAAAPHRAARLPRRLLRHVGNRKQRRRPRGQRVPAGA